MTPIRLVLAEWIITFSNRCARLAIALLPDTHAIEAEPMPVVLPPTFERTYYTPKFIDLQCALLVERYGHTIILANQTAYAIPLPEHKGRC